MNDFTINNNNDLNGANSFSHHDSSDPLPKSKPSDGKGHTFKTLKSQADNPITQLFLEKPIESSLKDRQTKIFASVLNQAEANRVEESIDNMEDDPFGESFVEEEQLKLENRAEISSAEFLKLNLSETDQIVFEKTQQAMVAHVVFVVKEERFSFKKPLLEKIIRVHLQEKALQKKHIRFEEDELKESFNKSLETATKTGAVFKRDPNTGHPVLLTKEESDNFRAKAKETLIDYLASTGLLKELEKLKEERNTKNQESVQFDIKAKWKSVKGDSYSLQEVVVIVKAAFRKQIESLKLLQESSRAFLEKREAKKQEEFDLRQQEIKITEIKRIELKEMIINGMIQKNAEVTDVIAQSILLHEKLVATVK